MTILLFSLLIGLLFLNIYRLDWGLMLILACLPLYVVRFQFAGIPSTLLEVMILITFFVWVGTNYKQLYYNIAFKINNKKHKSDKISNLNLSRYPFDLELVLVLVVSFVAMGVSGFSDSSMGIWKAYFFEPIIVYILIFNVFLSKKNKNIISGLTKIILPLIFAAFYVSAFAIYQKVTGNFIPNELWAASETRRVTSLLAYPNAVGLMLGPIFMIGFCYLLFIHNKYKKKSCRIQCTKWSPFNWHWFKIMPTKDKLVFVFIKSTLVLSVLSVFFARSEGALIAMGLAIVLVAFFSKSFKSVGFVRLLIIFFSAIFLLFIFNYSPLREFVVQKVKLDDFSGQIRKAQWQDTGIMLRDGNYLMGAGLAGYQEKIRPYHAGGIYIKNNDPDFDRLIKVSPEYQAKHWQALEIFLYPHNIFLNFWVELGLFGMLLFIWIILKVLYISLRLLFSEKLQSENRYLLLSAMSAMFVLLIHGIVDVPYFKNDLAIIFWVIVSIVGVVLLNDKAENNK